jgi:hypothetical protein
MMKSIVKNLALPAIVATVSLVTGVAVAQPTAQTPLSQPIQLSGSVTPDRSTSCGFLPNSPVQTLQVNEDFASLDIEVSGDSGITLYIEGSNGFMECFTTDNLSGSSIDAPGLLNRGNYSLFVGNSNQATTNYTLTIRQN